MWWNWCIDLHWMLRSCLLFQVGFWHLIDLYWPVLDVTQLPIVPGRVLAPGRFYHISYFNGFSRVIFLYFYFLRWASHSSKHTWCYKIDQVQVFLVILLKIIIGWLYLIIEPLQTCINNYRVTMISILMN